MSEAELRESLRAAVADEPPLHFDPDALIARAETFRRRRRALVAVGVATFALIGTVLALPGVLAPPRETVDAARVLTTTAAPSATPSAESVPVTSPAAVPLEDRVKRLSGYLAKQVVQVVPGAFDVEVDFSDTRKVSAGYVTGYVHLSDKRGVTSITVELFGPSARVTRAAFCGPERCDLSKLQPDGSHLEVAAHAGADGEPAATVVAHFRTDGSVVMITGHPYDTAQDGVTPPPAPALEQLIALATDPVLTLTG
ncbi:hypothetical protein [Saccharothrix variisporea]|uniref:Uncharacterized protein n=1 Tax=Saccharothrix variisporea TaxID=543527 RepID=A0A495XBZ2_9PSEU|nr:hypothetical protein [Saccharothrix variisporea]RKT71770.1 hypothetical protein DFJ66_5065 [Saccharothrix variisporea]